MATIKVSAIKLKDIPNVDSGPASGHSDPYVVVSCCKETAKTKTIWNTESPEYPDTLELSLPADTEYPVTVEVTVMDEDKKSEDDLIGKAQFTVLAPGAGVHRGGLDTKGTVALEWSATGGVVPVPEGTALTFTGIKLDNVLDVDGATGSDPYVVVEAGGVSAKTATIWNNHSPEFPETLTLDLPKDTQYPITVNVTAMDEDKESEDDVLGKSTFEICGAGTGTHSDKLDTQGTVEMSYLARGGVEPSAGGDGAVAAERKAQDPAVVEAPAGDDSKAAAKEAKRAEKAAAKKAAQEAKAAKAAEKKAAAEAKKASKDSTAAEVKPDRKVEDAAAVDAPANEPAVVAKDEAKKQEEPKKEKPKKEKKAAASGGGDGNKLALIGAILGALLLIMAIAINSTTSNVLMDESGVKTENGIWLIRQTDGPGKDDDPSPWYCGHLTGKNCPTGNKDDDCCVALEHKCNTLKVFAVFACVAALASIAGFAMPIVGVVGAGFAAVCFLIIFSVTASLLNGKFDEKGSECGFNDRPGTDVSGGAAFGLAIIAFVIAVVTAVLFGLAAKAAGSSAKVTAM